MGLTRERINFKVLKPRLFLLCIFFLCNLSVAVEVPRVNLCKTLTFPNSLLLDRFSKIKLKKICAQGPVISSLPTSHKKAGCYYQIPLLWADGINYSSLGQTGFVVTSKNEHASCPAISYSDFQTLTLKGKSKINKENWKTLQTNSLKRLLKKPERVLPLNSPAVIWPEEKLEISIYRFDELLIPLTSSNFPIH